MPAKRFGGFVIKDVGPKRFGRVVRRFASGKGKTNEKAWHPREKLFLNHILASLLIMMHPIKV